jgi:hypothetical protein
MAAGESFVLGTEIEKVRDDVPTLFERDDVFQTSVLKSSEVEVISSRDMRIPQELRPGGYYGYYNPNGGSLGRGSGPQYDKAVIASTHHKFGIEWTTQAQWSTDNSRKAVVNYFKKLLSTSMAEFRRQIEGQCMGAGDGVIGTISTVATNTPAGFDTLTLNSDGFRAKLVRFGQFVNIYNAALTVNRTAGNEQQIQFLDLAGAQIRITTGVAGIIATDKIVASGLSATPPVGLLGVQYHHSNASTGTWLGYDRSTTPEIRANRVAAGGPLVLPFARLAMNKAGDRVGKQAMMGLTAWMHPAQAQAYEELGQLVVQIHKQAKEEGLDLYFSDNMQMAGAGVKTSFCWDRTRIDFVNKSYWGRAELHPAGFYEVDGMKIWPIRSSDGGLATAQIFYLVVSFNLFVTNPAGCTYIDTLSIPSGY